MKKLLASLAVLAIGVAVSLATSASAKERIDSYCSPSGDFCQAITVNKQGVVKFSLRTFSFKGRYTICVKGPGGQECEAFQLESHGETYSDKVIWQDNFLEDLGTYKVTWKHGGKIGKTLKFTVDAPDYRAS